MNIGRIRAITRGQKPALGVHLSMLSAEVVELVGHLGFDWLFLDAQRTPLNPERCLELVRAAQLVQMATLVRVPEVSASIIESYLDIGVNGVVAADVRSAVDARAAVDAVKFAPAGHRGAAARTRAADYGVAGASATFYAQSNAATYVGVLIESAEGAENLAAIAGVAGVDALGVGPNDLGLSLGTHDGIADQRVRTIVDRCVEEIAKSGKGWLIVVGDVHKAKEACAQGASLIAVPDVVLLARSARDFLYALR
jgi:4-hydroxy-2-oxoheptanedioate aldolase